VVLVVLSKQHGELCCRAVEELSTAFATARTWQTAALQCTAHVSACFPLLLPPGGVRGGWDNLLAIIPGGSSTPLLPKVWFVTTAGHQQHISATTLSVVPGVADALLQPVDGYVAFVCNTGLCFCRIPLTATA
jgi:hypothetical protein